MPVILKYNPGMVKHAAKQAIQYADEIVRGIESGESTVTGDFCNGHLPEHTLYWSHELTILRICQAVRCGGIKTNDIRIHAENGEVVDVDVKGQFIQPWPTDLFELAFYCQFTKYDKICHIPGRSTFDPDTVEWKQ